MNHNYLKLNLYSPFTYSYIFVDCDKYLADRLFINHKVSVKFGREYYKEDSVYRIIFCKIKKRDEERFLLALSEMYNKMLLLGYTDYTDFCANFYKMCECAR